MKNDIILIYVLVVSVFSLLAVGYVLGMIHTKCVHAPLIIDEEKQCWMRVNCAD